MTHVTRPETHCHASGGAAKKTRTKIRERNTWKAVVQRPLPMCPVWLHKHSRNIFYKTFQFFNVTVCQTIFAFFFLLQILVIQFLLIKLLQLVDTHGVYRTGKSHFLSFRNMTSLTLRSIYCFWVFSLMNCFI